jgi:nucleotide-binding universal stress UspA family protein
MASVEQTAAATAQRHVLIAVDPSQASRHAASWALRNGLLPAGARLALVSVVPSPPLAPMAPGIAGVGGLTSTAGVAEYEKEWAATKEVHRQALAAVKDMLAKGGCVVTPDNCVLLDGDGAGGGAVGDPLLIWAKTHGVDHIITGSRGLSALKRGIYSLIGLGSVSDHLVRHSPCPITVVRMEGHAAAGAAKAA